MPLVFMFNCKNINIENDIELTPIVKSLKGAFKSDENFVYKEELLKSLEQKYL